MNRPSRILSAAIPAEMLGRAYLAALLLSGSTKRAEAVLHKAIERIDPHTVSETELILAAAHAALHLAGDAHGPDVPADLPFELQQVLTLPLDLRRSFVLRLLLGWSDEQCASARVRDVRWSAASAAKRLARNAKPRLETAA